MKKGQKEVEATKEKEQVRTIIVTTENNPGLEKIMYELSDELMKKNYDLYKRLENE